ncbi:MAG: RNA polymerase sigma-70 factor [Marinilabiliales bacterium]
MEIRLNKLDETSFEVLFKEHFTVLCAFARKYIRDLDASKEVVHDVFINLWNKRDSIDIDKPVKSYLFTSVHNRCLNYIRDNKKFDRENTLVENLKSKEVVDRDFIIEAETEARIKKAIDELPPKCKEVFLLSRYENMKYHEIADKCGISIKTVEGQISRALKMLRAKLSDLFILILLFCFML